MFMFGLNILSGYLAMLVAMTYSVELFLCMVAGLVAGHAIFNSGAAVGESVDPCCASQTIGQPDTQESQTRCGSCNALNCSVPVYRAGSKAGCCSGDTVALAAVCSSDICYDNSSFQTGGTVAICRPAVEMSCSRMGQNTLHFIEMARIT